MAFPTGWNRKCALVIQHGQVPADQTAFPVPITQACLPAEMMTLGGSHAAQTDGGDIRFSTDSAGANQIACEVAGWLENANPALATATIWVPVDILTASDVTIYVWYNSGSTVAQPAVGAAFGANAVWDASRKGVWHMETAAGGAMSLVDSTATANNLVTTPSPPTSGAGLVGSGGSYLASSSQANATGNGTPYNSNDETISCWFKTTTSGTLKMLMCRDTGSGTRHWQLRVDTDNKLRAGLVWGGFSFVDSGSTLVNDGSWHMAHLVFAFNGTNTLGDLYLDGIHQVATLSVSGAQPTSSLIMYIGEYGGLPAVYMNGSIDEPMISTSARSANWILTEFRSQAVPGSFVVAGTPQSGTQQVLNPDGIASAEAFGTATLLFNPVLLNPGGIASAEAFGTTVVGVGINIITNAGAIASAEAFGTPTLLETTGLRFRIGGRDRTVYLHHESDCSWNMMKGARGSCSIPLIVAPGDTYAPSTGELIEIFDPASERVWAGTVEQVFVRWFGDDGWHLIVVTGVTLESLFDTAFVDKTHFNGVSGGSAFSDLYTASGVTQVALGTVDAGETLSALEVTRIADGFSAIALRSNKIWFVDPADLTLNFVSSTSRAAPWVMGSEQMVWETMQWRQSRADFRDTQVIQSPDGASQTVIALTPNTSIGLRAARLTLTTSYTLAGAIQEATAALHRFSTLPAQLLVSTDKAGISIGMLLEINVDHPLEASGLLNGFWQVIEVEAHLLTGMDEVNTETQRVPTDLDLGHFRYTLHLVNSIAIAIFQGDGTTTVFTLPLTPGSVSSILVSPHPELYATSSLGPTITITPAMPLGTHGLVGYQGDSNPDVGTFLDTWKGMSPVSASAGPASGGSGATSQRYIADATLRDLTIRNDAGPHAIVYHDGSGVRALFVLRQTLGADLVLRINLDGNPLVTLVIDSGTAVDDVLEFPLSARKFTVTIASPGVVTLDDAALGDGDLVVIHTTGALPTGLVADASYFVVSSGGSTFSLALTLGGSPINTSGTQSGNHWLTSSAIAAPAFLDKDVLTYDILDSDEAIDVSPGGIGNATLEWE